jgi:hypothetical protein
MLDFVVSILRLTSQGTAAEKVAFVTKLEGSSDSEVDTLDGSEWSDVEVR